MTKLNFKFFRFVSCFLVAVSFLIIGNQTDAFAQLKEPPTRSAVDPRSPYEEGFRNRIGVNVVLNNFGFGVTGIYSRAIAPFTEITFTVGITGIRNPSAQKFVNYFTGRKVVPNRYKRALGFPLMVGIERRIFPYAIADNFRLFVSADFGPAFAFTYPYLNDVNNNGYRDTFRRCFTIQSQRICRTNFIPDENINSFFGDWGEGDWHVGFTGDLSIGVDIGSDFENQFTLEIGYFFYYFPSGLQLMEPKKNYGDDRGYDKIAVQNGVTFYQDVGQQPFYDERSYFGTPQIKISYSWWL